MRTSLYHATQIAERSRIMHNCVIMSIYPALTWLLGVIISITLILQSQSLLRYHYICYILILLLLLLFLKLFKNLKTLKVLILESDGKGGQTK